MRKIFHLEIKSENSHKYYGSLSALCRENPNLDISKFSLDRFDFSEPFENETCIIRKSVMKTTGSVGEKKLWCIRVTYEYVLYNIRKHVL